MSLIFPRMHYNILFIRIAAIPNIRRIAFYLDPIISATASYCAMCNFRARINGAMRSMDLSVSRSMVIAFLRALRCLISKRGFFNNLIYLRIMLRYRRMSVILAFLRK